MPRITVKPRVLCSPVPQPVLNSVRGNAPASLLERMRRHNMNIVKLTELTGLALAKVQAVVYGEAPPISTRGSWTKEAIRIARALKTTPHEIFGEALNKIQSAMAMPGPEILPPDFFKSE